MGFPAVPTIWEPITTVSKLDFEVINLLKELIFAARCTNKPIYGFSMGA